MKLIFKSKTGTLAVAPWNLYSMKWAGLNYEDEKAKISPERLH